MIMRFIPVGGGRLFEYDGPYGKVRVEWNAEGKLISESIEIRTPEGAQPTPQQQNRPMPTLKMMKDWTVAATGGEYVSPEVQKEREDICATCDMARQDDKGVWCGVCGCGVSGDVRRIRNLAAYVECLDGDGATWGCKHPERDKGKGWKR